jgi:chaperone BCS1
MRIKQGTFCFYHLSCFIDFYLDLIYSITLSGLLNILDGVGAGEGRILVATTNYYDRLDEALRRPGRIDLEVKFELASKHQAREQFHQFYVPHTITKDKKTGVALAKSKSLIQSLDQGEDGGSAITSLGEKYFEDSQDFNSDDLKCTTRFDQLADKFVEDFQEHVISSASLQQYLLMYKAGPIEAVANFKAWVEAEIDGKERKHKEASDSKPLTEYQGNGHSLGTVLDEKVHSSMSIQIPEKMATEREGGLEGL